MTDEKLHYTDPLAAAYMAREFGVVSDHSRWDDDYLSSVLAVRDSDDMYFVGTDSYHIFEPQVGDKDEDGFRFENGAWVRIEMNGYIRIIDADESYTARRNNKPFFWPEGGV